MSDTDNAAPPDGWRPILTAPYGERVLVGYTEDHPMGGHVKIGVLHMVLDCGEWVEDYWEVEDGQDPHDPDEDGSKYAPRWWMPLPLVPDDFNR